MKSLPLVGLLYLLLISEIGLLNKLLAGEEERLLEFVARSTGGERLLLSEFRKAPNRLWIQETESSGFRFLSRSLDFFNSDGVKPVIFLNCPER